MQRRTFLAALPGTAMAVPQLTAPAGAPTAGCAERDITPQVGMEQPGGYGKVYHKTFHNACKVRAAVLDDGAGRVALVGVDALMVPRRTVLAAREAIQKRCGILPAAIMIGASHSHSSGPTGMVQPGEFEHASQLARQLAYEKSSAAEAGYLRKVEAGIVDAVCAADAKRGPGRVGFGAGVEDKAAFNRRFLMQNGLTFTHPGKGNPDVVKAAGPIDPAVTVLGCWDAGNNLAGCVVNYACHATTSPGGISAKWIYYLEQTIRGSFGPGVVVVFLAGFCGDVTQVDNLDPHVNPTAENWARIVGGRVGAEAVKVLLSMWPDRSLKLAHAQKLLRLDRRIPDRGRVKRCLEIARERQVEVELQAIQAGPAVFLSAPGEMFCQLGLDLRARSVTCQQCREPKMIQPAIFREG